MWASPAAWAHRVCQLLYQSVVFTLTEQTSGMYCMCATLVLSIMYLCHFWRKFWFNHGPIKLIPAELSRLKTKTAALSRSFHTFKPLLLCNCCLWASVRPPSSVLYIISVVTIHPWSVSEATPCPALVFLDNGPGKSKSLNYPWSPGPWVTISAFYTKETNSVCVSVLFVFFLGCMIHL